MKSINIFSEVEDRISSLTDDLLHHILSFLPTLNSVRTSALSQRWRHLWKSVQTLHFDNLDWWNCKGSLADQILCKNSKIISKLHFHCTRIERDLFRIVPLLGRKIRELDIDLPICLPEDLIESFRYCEILQVLKIRCNFKIYTKNWTGFRSLKVLRISISNPCNVSMQTLSRSCSVLEELVLVLVFDLNGSHRLWNKSFEIFVPTLKRLSMRIRHGKNYEFDVTVPALECLDIKDSEFSQYKFRDMPCLKKAKLDVVVSNFGEAKNRAMQLLCAVASTSSLSLSATTMCILNSAHGVLNSLTISNSARGMNLPSFPNLTRLEVQVFHGFSWNLVIEFLENSPNLEILILRKEAKQCWHCLETPSWTPKKCAPSCLLLNINVIEIVGFKGGQEELELLEYLLKNAKMLDKLTINSINLDPNDAICKNLLDGKRQGFYLQNLRFDSPPGS
ncbi:hypothetical protein ACSBR2_028271 [Camellia fascicularis]